MRLRYLLVLLMLPSLALAGDFESIGIGGGGWLHSGTFHPEDPNIMLIGSDVVGGVYRTTDQGANWDLWNEGLANPNASTSQYVEDLLGIKEGPRTVAFYAATYGGIYRADEDGPWVLETRPEDGYCYVPDLDLTYKNISTPISFACLDYDPASKTLAAGAGRARWDRTYEIENYPGLPPEDFGSCEAFGDQQLSVWLKEGTSWQPMPDAEFGAVRDISVAKFGKYAHIVIATNEGIYHWDGTGWTDLSTRPLMISKGFKSEPMNYGSHFTAWTLHLTDRGALYVALQMLAPTYLTDATSGVYMISDITKPNQPWESVGDYGPATVDGVSLYQLGRESLGQDFNYVSVAEGVDEEPDILWLGDRTGRHGLFRGEVPYAYSTNRPRVFGPQPYLCDWENRVYTRNWYDYFYRSYDGDELVEQEWPDEMLGYLYDWGVGVLFEPILYPGDPQNVLALQFNARFHVTNDGGDSWQNRYCTGDASGWTATGYNELCVWNVDFLSDGRLVEAAGDLGVFRSTSSNHSAFQYLRPHINQWASPTDDSAWTNEAFDVQVRPDWKDGKDYIFATFGKGYQYRTPCKLLMTPDDPTPSWTNVTKNVPELDRHALFAIAFSDDQTAYVSYRKYDRKVGTWGPNDPVMFEKCGVMKLSYNGVDWDYEDCSDGLNNPLGLEMIYHAPTKHLFLATAQTKGTLTTQEPFLSRGSIWALDTQTGPPWIHCFGGEESTEHWKDFKCIAQSFGGERLYAGTAGNQGVRGGVVMCPDPSADYTNWVPIANGPEQGNTFDHDPPFWIFTSAPGSWTLDNYWQWLTSAQGIAVSPTDPTHIYVGLSASGFLETDGLWEWSLADGWSAEPISDDEEFAGLGVRAAAFNPYLLPDEQLVVGVDGSELFMRYETVAAKTPPGIEPEAVARPGLSMRVTSNEPGQSSATTVIFRLERTSRVKLQIYDLRGRLVWETTTGPLPAGERTLTWPGLSRDGKQVASGVYLARMSAGREAVTAKMRILR